MFFRPLLVEEAKELKSAKAQWEKQLREAEQNIVRLEQQLKGLTEKYDILQLDYDSAVADRQNVDDDSDSQLMKKRHMLEEERDHFKSLYKARDLLLKAAIFPAHGGLRREVRLLESQKHRGTYPLHSPMLEKPS